MDQFNQIELRGTIGNIKLTPAGENEVAHISLATNYVYKSKNGSAVIETCWHNVTIWGGRGMPDLSALEKGTCLAVTGRMKNNHYQDFNGEDRYVYEVHATKVDILDGPLKMQSAL